jgi:hypothetical protein
MSERPTMRDLRRFARYHGLPVPWRYWGGPLRWYVKRPEMVRVVRGRAIPSELTTAARRAGLRSPHGYIGPLVDPYRPRKHTVASIIARVKSQ